MTELGLTKEQLNLYIQGNAAFQFLTAGVELGLFDRLAQSPCMTSEEIAAAIDLEPQPARILLAGMLALKLLQRKDGRYSVDPLARQVLTSASPRSMVPVLHWIKNGINRGLVDMTQALRENRNVGLDRFAGEGGTIYHRLDADPKLSAVFQRSLGLFARGAAMALVQTDTFRGLSHLLDVGGGDATHAMALARALPDLRITIFDSPAVCAVADARIAEAGLSDRIATHAGDLFDDPFPTEIDGIFMSELTPIWSPERNRSLFRRAHDALPDGGALVILSIMLDDAEDGPLGAAMFSPYFLTIASGEGMAYPARDYATWLDEAGFGDVATVPTGLPLNQHIVVGRRLGASRRMAA